MKGEKGDEGLKGPVGAAGLPGEQGKRGVKGSEGIQGINADKFFVVMSYNKTNKSIRKCGFTGTPRSVLFRMF